ncbi:MAG: hypothetical protein HXX19_10660 [Rhodoferax sp.]|nr:hypothetical protein [Rhodoferax sp.]
MPRKISVIAEIITAKLQEQQADRERLQALKQKAPPGSNPDALIKKQIDALRITIANGAEDLQDLDTELAEATAFEASEFGREKIARAQDKLRAADALVDVCITTAANADKALSAAWVALRQHYSAHMALNDAVGGAYNAVVDGSGFDTHGDQLFLLRSYSNLRNSGGALAEWLLESLQGYDLENHIQVSGITLNPRDHETLQRVDASGLARCWNRLKEVATRCGVEVHKEDDPMLPLLRKTALDVLQTAKLR